MQHDWHKIVEVHERNVSATGGDRDAAQDSLQVYLDEGAADVSV